MKGSLFVSISLSFLVIAFYLDHIGVNIYFLSVHSLVYNLTLLSGFIIGITQYKKRSKILKLVTILFLGVFLSELGVLILVELKLLVPLYYFLLLFFLLLLHHLIFSQFLEQIGKQKKGLNLFSLLVASLFLSIMIYHWNLSGFPSIAVSLFCIYVISMSLYTPYHLIEVPIKTRLWINPVFLFSVATLVMYSLKFWNVSFRPVLHKLPMEIMLKYKFLLFNFSNYIMEIAYCVFVFILLYGDKKEPVQLEGN